MGNREGCGFCKACDDNSETSNMAKNPYEKVNSHFPVAHNERLNLSTDNIS